MRKDLESSCIGRIYFKMALVTVSSLDYDPRREIKTVKRSIITITDANKCVLPLRQGYLGIWTIWGKGEKNLFRAAACINKGLNRSDI